MGDEPDLDPDISRSFFEGNVLNLDPSFLTENGIRLVSARMTTSCWISLRKGFLLVMVTHKHTCVIRINHKTSNTNISNKRLPLTLQIWYRWFVSWIETDY